MRGGAAVGRACDRALQGLGLLALLGSLATALHDASQAFDSFYYHLPFAARLAGLLPEGAYAFHAANRARFAGFALFCEMAQGLLWRLTGRVESANLVAFASLPLLAWFLAKRWKVPPALTVLGLLAVPLVQAHAPSAYVDLPGNAAAAIVVLLVIEAHASRDPLPARDVLLALVAGAIAANTKPLLQPVVGLGLGAILLRALRDKPTRSLGCAMLLTAPVVLFTPLKDAYLFGNPFYPIDTHLLGLHFAGPEEPYSYAPAWLARLPNPARFAASLLEIGIRPWGDPRRWTVDQWMPEESGGNRLGGDFGLYMAFLVGTLLLRARRGASRVEKVALAVFAALTVVVACMPQSLELRYYLVWPIVLVCLSLGLACRAPHRRWTASLRLVASGSAVAFAVVALSTRGAYLLAGGMTADELVRARVDERALDGVEEGELVCVRQEPFNLLWAARFHPGRRYAVQEAEGAEDCRGAREIGR